MTGGSAPPLGKDRASMKVVAALVFSHSMPPESALTEDRSGEACKGMGRKRTEERGSSSVQQQCATKCAANTACA